MKAAELGLRGAALAGAAALEKQFPFVVFTSGRRGIADQARAMAQNVVQNRRWIEQTYLQTAERDQLVSWLRDHREADTVAEIQSGLVAIMAGWNDQQKGRLSKHFSGDAFDVQPLAAGPRATAVVAAIRALPGLTRFLEREGGLKRWHAQFA